MHRFQWSLLLVFALALSACSSDTGLADATEVNLVDTTTVWALQGTSVSDPSGFSVPDRSAIRTDASAAFDFAFNIDGSGKAVFLPIDLLGLGSVSGTNPGLLVTSLAFDSIRTAVQNDYVFDDTVNVVVGSSYYVRSRVVCSTLQVPLYGKIEVLSVDTAERSLTFRYLVDNNCGYLGLEPGIPRQ
jgi:hypothetical protein